MKAIYAVPATFLLCYRAWSHKSLTNAGIFAAALTSVAHTVHPGNLPFALLAVFFLAAIKVTKVVFDLAREIAQLIVVADQAGCQGQVDDTVHRGCRGRPSVPYPR
jgi:uncharacterized membrane protein